jgi:prevent-host-death family protein
MEMVGVKELKTRLTHYLGLAKQGEKVIVTDRGKPVAILHNLDITEENVSFEERLSSLAKRGLVRLPRKKVKLAPIKPIKAKGKPASEIIIEDRR